MKALCLSGGGSKGAAQIGCLHELLETNPDLEYDLICGISVGALNGSFLATGPLKETLPELERIWLDKIKGNASVWQHNLWDYILISIIIILAFTIAAFICFILSGPKLLTILFGLLALCSFYIPYYALTHTHSIYDSAPLRNIVFEGLDLDKLKTSGKKLRVGAVSLTTGKYMIGTEQDSNIREWIMASSAFPVFFPMEQINNEYYTDGGVINISNLSDAIALGATEIDVILCSPIKDEKLDGKVSIIKQLLRNMDIMSSEILRNDLEARCNEAEDHVKIRIFMPEKQLTSNSLDFSPDKIRKMYEDGKVMAKRVLHVS